MDEDEYNYEFVIDTDEYAGNFEREMCAYVTGRVGDCQVGEDIAEKVRDEIEQSDFFDEIDRVVVTLPDDHGCHRPVSIGPTPGYSENQSVEIHLHDIPTDDLVDFFMTRALAFASQPHDDDNDDGDEFSIIGFRLVRRYEVRDTLWSRRHIEPVDDG